ncbi:Retrovirus-related Pol polyprotein from transposon RE1 [Vitis vinifera]|uniref:Retrovirus-related Pol polyprotein from transposon RE1 n=1 Tax=Vitis vinifera TaxID=29760 RepID=A0A438D8T8_VITVI|nr:Retrovirus-related Pol polyprotein from transposon RE1 [Vitis vinifera]
MGFIDGNRPCPPPILKVNGVDMINPEYSLWICQDQPILNVIVGSLSSTIIPFITSLKTSKNAWTTLATTYAKPLRGRVMQIKGQLANLYKGSQRVIEYMQQIKSRSDELAMMDAPINQSHLKNCMRNSLILKPSFSMKKRRTIIYQSLQMLLTKWEMGHRAKHCPSFRYMPWNTQSFFQPQSSQHSRSISNASCVNFAAQPDHASSSWLLDSGASHHVTIDLNNLSLHSPYASSDDMIGDDTGFSIIHTGSTTIPSPSQPFKLTNDLRMGARLLQGPNKNGVYEWLTQVSSSPPLIAFF